MRQLNINNATEPGPKTTAAQRKKAVTLMDHLEIVIEEAEGSRLSKEFFRKVKTHTNFIASALGLTPMQSILFALFLEQCSDSRILISDFTRLLGCRTIKIIALMSDIDCLEQKRFIRCSRQNGTICYRVPLSIIEAVKKNQPIETIKRDNLSNEELFEQISELISERKNDELKEGSLLQELDDLVRDNHHLAFAQKFLEYSILDKQERLLFYGICNSLISENDDSVCWEDFEDLYDRKWVGEVLRGCISEETTQLQLNQLIEFCNSDGFGDREAFHLSNKAKNELFAEINLKTKSKKAISKGLLKHIDITHKQLYYNPTESQQIETLTAMMQQSNFKSVQQRLHDSGMRKGFACLFYGAPGTGKTETVYQLAKHTQRDIMAVNISEIKSMWVGESEKNIKLLFERYRALVKECDTAPILLFNEADAIIGIRQERAERAVDKMENSIQNIILSEMETLDGIMIATTNLTQNLDKAFERRFLYKIEFLNPTQQAKQNIWQTVIPTLPESWAQELSLTYEFSGGQIENIARKQTINHIISGEEPSLDSLKNYCHEELLNKKTSRRPIGYK